ncbi:tripartite tricarboxylate transporter substrate binding protein [Polynucleobacter sp. UK-Mo-2m-Kol15]|uniref:tripartite tricarboxylate transporter substrate binding protein n=1 Tax=Polynucleobacter sp. UK-Mo-2m-Kol15 TaxID=2576916 RepID=UPI001C0C7167|nr:tripartite tricarboxylate transporter substrate binding protein [Polynucleobacter sp. UK-Mo-2m-Kol15]MBU3576200.1 tripartite tricarboxylate transporter substrate binding protein [Polynucleobacter sp. UK-Mo-2m-Kol15]
MICLKKIFHCWKQFITLAVFAFTPVITLAQAYPNKPITIVVPFVAGGSTDVTARAIGQKLSTQLGQPIVVENKPGAGSTIGVAYVAKAPSDGYTLLFTTISMAINASLRPKLTYDSIKDLQPIIQISSLPLVLVINPNLPPKTFQEFIAYAKANAGKLNYASSGSGTSPHLAGEMFKTMTGISMTHIPYKGNAPVLNDLLAGQVDAHFGLVPGMLPYIKSGKLRALAVTTKTRVASLPDVPTIMELGYPNYEINSWQGLFAPANTPPDIITKLNETTNRILSDPEFRAVLAKEGSDPVGGSISQFSTHVVSEVNKWAKVVKDSGAQAD